MKTKDKPNTMAERLSASETEPLCNDKFHVIFPVHSELLNSMVKNVSDGLITFDLRVDKDGRVLPLREIAELCVKGNGQNMKVCVENGAGKVILTLEYVNCTFLPDFTALTNYTVSPGNMESKELQMSFTRDKLIPYDHKNERVLAVNREEM